jgi:uncharacterized protein YkwD
VGVVALTALHSGGFRTPATHAAGDCTVDDLTFDDQEREFARLINDYRESIGVPPLTVSENLNKSASWLAKDMAEKNYFSHEDSYGRHSEERGADCGTTTKIGENIAAGPTRDTAQEVFDAWKASEGHDKNMRRADYLQIGIARYYKADSDWGWYWVTDFSLNTDNTNLLDVNVDLPIVGGIGISIPNPLSTSSPTLTPTPTSTRTPTPTRTATATSTPTRTPTSQASSTAELISPAPGSTLSGTSATFSWSAASGASAYQLYVGTTAGGYDIRNVRTTSTSTSVSNLPRGGMTIYVRLWTQTASGWKFNDYTLTAAAQGSTATATSTPTRTPTPESSSAQLTSPAPGSTLSGTSATFSWTSVSGATAYQLYVGTTAGGYDIRNVRTTATSTSVTNLPRGSRTVYVRLWTQTAGGWRFNDYTLTSAP